MPLCVCESPIPITKVLGPSHSQNPSTHSFHHSSSLPTSSLGTTIVSLSSFYYVLPICLLWLFIFHICHSTLKHIFKHLLKMNPLCSLCSTFTIDKKRPLLTHYCYFLLNAPQLRRWHNITSPISMISIREISVCICSI